MTKRALRIPVHLPDSIDASIRYANDHGLQCHRLSQLENGTWRASFVVFPATPELARNPVWTDYGLGASPVEAMHRALLSDRYRMAWEEPARQAVEARRTSRIGLRHHRSTTFSDEKEN